MAIQKITTGSLADDAVTAGYGSILTSNGSTVANLLFTAEL